MEFTPEETEVGERIDLVIARRAGVTRAVARSAVEGGSITVGGATVKPGHRLAVGESVAGEVVVPPERLPQPEDIPVVIRHEDEAVLVVSKPAGLVTHPVRGHQGGTLVNALLNLGRPLSQVDPLRPGIVHRLDKDTSGLLVIAKDDATQLFLREAMKKRRIERRYYALVRGVPTEAGSVEAPIGRHPRYLSLMAVAPEGRPAVTHYRVLDSTDRVALVDVRLETGRTHQIRVHLAHIGHPVLGDRVYGGVSDLSRSVGLERPFLHAYRLAFPTPAGGRIEVSDGLPPDLTDALARAGLSLPQA